MDRSHVFMVWDVGVCMEGVGVWVAADWWCGCYRLSLSCRLAFLRMSACCAMLGIAICRLAQWMCHGLGLLLHYTT